MSGTRGPVPVPLVTSNPTNGGTRDLTLEILSSLESDAPVHTADAFPHTPQPEIKAALDRLASRQMVAYDTNDSEVVVLTEEGRQIEQEGSHEWKVWDAVRKSGRVGLKDPVVSRGCV